MTETLVDTMCRSITDPRCDECGVSVQPDDPLLGPHLCAGCSAKVTAYVEAGVREFVRDGQRRVHVIRVPPGFIWNHGGAVK